jgi:RNA polymerase sigma factor (sigma-70 family)
MQPTRIKTVIEQHHLDFYGWSVHCCRRDRELASEVLQTSYLKMLERQDTFMQRSDFKTWGFAIIRNSALDAFRSRTKEARLIDDEEDLPEAGYDAGFDIALDQTITQEFFTIALNQLSMRQREIFQLVFYHDLTLNQSSEVLGLSAGTVRKHYDRAKKTLSVWFQRKALT